MPIVASVLLILSGAVLYFTTDLRVGDVKLDFICLIPMLAGLLGLLLELRRDRGQMPL